MRAAAARAWALVRDAAAAWFDDDAPSMGASLAYYTLFSIAPLLLIAISVAGLLFGQQAARAAVLAQLSDLVGPQSVRTIESMLVALDRPQASASGAVLGVATLLVGATSVFAELQSALDRIWRAPPRPPGPPAGLGALWGWLRTRLLSLGLILGLGFLLLVSLLASTALAALNHWVQDWAAPWALIAQLANEAFAFVFVTAVFVAIYKWMPRVPVAWRDVWLGAVVTSALFMVGKGLIGLYLGNSGVADIFGAAASLVVLMIWIYWSAQIFLLGAEFTRVYAHRRGSRAGTPLPAPRPQPPADPAERQAAAQEPAPPAA